MTNEKRKAPRIPASIRAEVHAKDGMTFSSSIDLSQSGIFITTPEPIDPGTELTLNIELTPVDHISVKGIVRWTRDEDDTERAGMGIEFVDISDVALNVIKNLSEPA